MTNDTSEYLKSREIYLIGNAHLDPVWLWRWTEGFSEVKATFRSALDRLRDYPGFVFTCAGACYYKWVEENCPEMFEEIRSRVAEGRWAVVGGWWIQPDCNIPCGESFARHSLYSQRYYREKFGILCDTGYNVDSFGHSGMLPQILKKSGMDNYVFMRPSEIEKPGVPNLFIWESGDGSSVLTYRIPMSYNLNETAQLPEKLEITAGLGHNQNIDMMLFYGVGNHGGGPTVSVLNAIETLQRETGGSALVFNAPSKYMDAVRPMAARYPVIRDDLQIHAIGCYSAYLKIKQLNRQAENALLSAERFDILAHSLLGTPVHTEKLKDAWEKVLFNQFHDILCGCCIKSAYEDAKASFGYALTIAGEVQNSALQRLSWAVDTMEGEELPRSKEEDWKLWGLGEKGTPLIVFNPLPYEAEFPVEAGGSLARVTDAAKNTLPSQTVRSQVTNGEQDKWNTLFMARLPALGYGTFWLHKNAPESPAEETAVRIARDGSCMENETVEVRFNAADGTISGIHLRENGKQLLRGPAAVGLVIDETHSDTWGHGLREYRDVVARFYCRSFTVIERGPVRCRIRAEYAYGDSTMTQDFLLYGSSPDVEVRVKVHWREKHKMLKLEFPVDIRGGKSAAEIPYGVIERPMDGTEKPIQRWIDVSGDGGGLAVVNDSSYAADILDGTIRLTLLRSPIFADHFGARDDLCEFMEQGEHELQYRLVPHSGRWQTAGLAEKALAFNMLPQAIYETYHSGLLPAEASGLCVSPRSITVDVLKAAEDSGGVILRCHETVGLAATAELEIVQLRRRWVAAFGPYEIKTFFIPDDSGEDIREVNLLEM